jgi:hypothetical protein
MRNLRPDLLPSNNLAPKTSWIKDTKQEKIEVTGAARPKSCNDLAAIHLLIHAAVVYWQYFGFRSVVRFMYSSAVVSLFQLSLYSKLWLFIVLFLNILGGVRQEQLSGLHNEP